MTLGVNAGMHLALRENGSIMVSIDAGMRLALQTPSSSWVVLMQVCLGRHLRVAVSAGGDSAGHAGQRGGGVGPHSPEAQPLHVLHDPAAGQALRHPLRPAGRHCWVCTLPAVPSPCLSKSSHPLNHLESMYALLVSQYIG